MVVKVVLDGDFYNPVRFKCKTAFTLIRDNGLRRGDEFILFFDGVRGGGVRCMVDHVVKCSVDDIDFLMARAEGYVCSDLFVHMLRSVFDDFDDGGVVFQYYFKIL